MEQNGYVVLFAAVKLVIKSEKIWFGYKSIRTDHLFTFLGKGSEVFCDRRAESGENRVCAVYVVKNSPLECGYGSALEGAVRFTFLYPPLQRIQVYFDSASCIFRARTFKGRPKRVMKPSASWWSYRSPVVKEARDSL